MLSGDWIPTDLPARFAAVGGEHRFISMGGATEGSVWSIWYEVDRVDESWTSIPYGTPMANQAFHVLDERGEPCPVGVPGELHIGGVGVMMGYWREPELTARALVELPKLPGVSYRTGDLGRRLSNGTIEFLGRTDFQVKIRGFRVETGEIESVLLRHSTVAAAVVVAQKHGDENRLVAYVVTTQPTEAKELRACLGAKLPEYMIPLHWVFLEELPLSANGKVDRKALPAIEDSRAQGAVTAARTPVTETERALAKVVGEVLRHRPAVVVIALGANDALRGLPLREMRRNLARMVGASQHVGARVLLVGMRMPPNYGPDYTRGFEQNYSVLAKQYDTALLPFLLEPIALDRNAYQADNLHPVASAQPKLRDHAWKTLEPLLR